MTTQLCTKCNKTKHLSEFNKDKSKKTGYRRECKTCVSIAQSKYRKQKYREQHKNSIKIKKSIYQKQNKEKINTWRKQWRQTPQGILSLQKQKAPGKG